MSKSLCFFEFISIGQKDIGNAVVDWATTILRNAPRKNRVLKNCQMRLRAGKILDIVEYVNSLRQLDDKRVQKKKRKYKKADETSDDTSVPRSVPTLAKNFVK